MKKFILGLAVLVGTAFFVPTTQILADNIGNANANSSPLKQKVDEKTSYEDTIEQLMNLGNQISF